MRDWGLCGFFGAIGAIGALVVLVFCQVEPATAGPGLVEVTSNKGAIHVRVSVRYDATTQELQQWQDIFADASTILYEATEGQFYVADVVVCNSCLGGEQADIWLQDDLRRSYIDITWNTPGIAVPNVRGYFSVDVAVSPAKGSTTVAHEFAHYVLGLYDEYAGWCCNIPIPCESTTCIDHNSSDPACLLDNYLLRTRTELCGPWNHDQWDDPNTFCDESYDTVQQIRYGMSCWETVGTHYPWVTVPAGPPTSGQNNPPAMNWNVNAGLRSVILLEEAQGTAQNVLRDQADAAGLIIERLPPSSEVAIVTYNDKGISNYLVPMTKIEGPEPVMRATRDRLRAAVTGRQPEPCQELCERPKPLTALQQSLALFSSVPGEACIKTAFLIGSGNVHAEEPAPLLIKDPFTQDDIFVNTLAIIPDSAPADGLGKYASIAELTFGKGYVVIPSGDGAVSTCWALLDDVFAMSSPDKGNGNAGGSGDAPATLAAAASEGGGANATETVTIEPGLNSAAFLLSWDDALGTLTFNLKPPTGDAWSCSSPPEGVDCIQGPGYAAFNVPTPEAGDWDLHVIRTASPAIPYTFRVSADSPAVHLDVWQPGGSSVEWPDPVTIKARALSGSPVRGISMTCEVRRPDGGVEVFDLHDDGSAEHGDVVADDGEFSTIYYGANMDGVYAIEATADNSTDTGMVYIDVPGTPMEQAGPFVRSSLMTVSVTGERDPVEDVNADGSVTEDDIYLLAQYLGETTGSPGYWRYADVNSDGIVDVVDYARVARKIDTGSPAEPEGPANPPAAAMSLTPAGGNYGPGQRVNMTLDAVSASDLYAFQAIVDFPGDHLMLHSDIVLQGNLLGNPLLMHSRGFYAAGKPKLLIVGSMLGPVSGVTGDGELAEFTLWTRCAGAENVTLEGTMLNSALAEIPVNESGATFTVTATPDATPPGAFTIDDGGKYTSMDFGINTKWTSSADHESGVNSYMVAIGTAGEPTSMMNWRPHRPTFQTFFFFDDGKKMEEGVEYFIQMQAINGQCMTSPIAVSDGIRYAPDYTLGETRSLVNGRFATVNATATARFDDRAWLTDFAGVMALGVEAPPEMLPGASVTAAGMLSVLDGMRLLTDSEVRVWYTGAAPLPIHVPQWAMGGSDLNPFIPGITGGAGLYNIGMLARTAGRVTSTGAGFFYCNDGSNLSGSGGETGVKVLTNGAASPPEGSFVAVTGIIETENDSGTIFPVLRTRDAGDVVAL